MDLGVSMIATSKNKIVKSLVCNRGSISTGMQGATIIVNVGAYQKPIVKLQYTVIGTIVAQYNLIRKIHL